MAVEMAKDVGVIIVAAGSGSRFGAKKQLRQLRGKPLLIHSVEVFGAIERVREIVVVTGAEDIGAVERLLLDRRGSCRTRVVAGGERRQDSVRRGLDALAPECAWTLVHDAARPLVTAGEVLRILDALVRDGAAAIGHPSSDSVKEERGGVIARHLDRDHVWLVQTPQGASTARLRQAFESAEREGRTVTDEASLLAALGDRIALVEGSRWNIKVTFPEDIDLAEHLLARRHGDG